MADASEPRFDVYFAGECLKGHDTARVRAALGKLFKAQEQTLERLFSGTEQPIKRGCDKATALNYQRAMTKAGAKPIIRRVSPGEATSSRVTPPGETAELTVAPSGTDVLRPEERATVEVPEIPTEHLQLEPPGDRLAPPAPVVEELPVPDFELADVGADLGGPSDPTDPALPDITSLTLAPQNHDLSDCAAPTAAIAEIALDHLDLDDPGTDILSEEERRRPESPPPDTSHISLEDPTRD